MRDRIILTLGLLIMLAAALLALATIPDLVRP